MKLRYKNVEGHVGDSFFQFNGMLMFSKEEITCGVISSLIIICPTIFLIILFRKSAPFSRRKSRFDKVIDDAAALGKIILPQKSHTRKVVDEK